MTYPSDNTSGIDSTSVAIRWLGHAGVSIRVRSTKLLFDPLLRRRIGHIMRRTPIPESYAKNVDAVCLSHAHHDHLDLPSLKHISAASHGVEWHAPRGAASTLKRARLEPLIVRELGDERAVKDLLIHTVQASHGGERSPIHRRDREQAEAVGYVIETIEGLRVWFAGDTQYFDEIEQIGPIDVALVPIGGWWRTLGPGHMDGIQAAEAVLAAQARIAIPIHWGTYHPIGLYSFMRSDWFAPANQFLNALADTPVDVRILSVGEQTIVELG